MTLYDVAPTILGAFDSHLSDYASKKFSRKGIKIKTGKLSHCNDFTFELIGNMYRTYC